MFDVHNPHFLAPFGRSNVPFNLTSSGSSRSNACLLLPECPSAMILGSPGASKVDRPGRFQLDLDRDLDLHLDLDPAQPLPLTSTPHIHKVCSNNYRDLCESIRLIARATLLHLQRTTISFRLGDVRVIKTSREYQFCIHQLLPVVEEILGHSAPSGLSLATPAQRMKRLKPSPT